MAEINDAELTTIENFAVTVRQALEQDQSPQAQELSKMAVEIEQITGAHLDTAANQSNPAAGATQSQTLAAPFPS